MDLRNRAALGERIMALAHPMNGTREEEGGDGSGIPDRNCEAGRHREQPR
jgi:hypothetical protein